MTTARIRIKRVYAEPAADDGLRILVDRLWPRGLTKAAARLDHWAKEIAPSSELRRWYGHDPVKWKEFRSRYFAELDERTEAVGAFRGLIAKGRVTFLSAAKAEKLSHAVALREYLGR